MSDLFPTELGIYRLFILLMTGTIVLGFVMQKGYLPYPRISAWLLAILAPATTYIEMRDQNPVFLMVALILALLYGMKTVVTVWAPRKVSLDLGRWLAFTTTWFGMRVDPFQQRSKEPRAGFKRLIVKGALAFLFGLILIVLTKRLWAVGIATEPTWIVQVALLGLFLLAISLVLHFGTLTLLAGFWRWRGVPVGVLFNAPFKATSLNEFWGRRWNIAFAEMTAIAVYRPIRGVLGDTAAKRGAYLFSGIAHELAISVPVNAGYGLPAIYFILQAIGAWAEQRFGLTGRLWT